MGARQYHPSDTAVLLHWYIDAAAEAGGEDGDAHADCNAYRIALASAHGGAGEPDRDTAADAYSMVPADTYADAAPDSRPLAHIHEHAAPNGHADA